MDRSKWEYKKLGEVCTVVSGSTPKTQIEEYWNGSHFWITPAELDGSTYVSKSDRLITDLAIEKTNLTLMPTGTVLLSSRAPIGKVAITTVPMYCNQGFKNLICSPAVHNKYLYWFLKGKTDYLNSLGRGATFKEISKTIVENIKIPIYSIEVQQSISDEIDCLNEMIAVKQEQLKEFDKLAQSIFYDMFGDPVANEKGWEKKTIGEVASFYNGKAHENDIDENGEFILVNAKFIASEGLVLKRTNKQLFPLYEKDIVMVMSDVPNGKALARCYLIKHNNIYSLNQRICAFRDYSQNPIFLLFLLNRNKYYLRFDDGNGQTNLRKNDVLGCPIILPPLSLQQQFAEKISAIEAQKELVKQSIAETQHLLDYTMDKYFG